MRPWTVLLLSELRAPLSFWQWTPLDFRRMFLRLLRQPLLVGAMAAQPFPSIP